MIPLKDIKVESARMKRENKGIVISPADPSESYLKEMLVKLSMNLLKSWKRKSQLKSIFILLL